MRNINNTYLVKNAIENKENISAYKVKNLQNNKRYLLYIIETGTKYEIIREYILNTFKTLKNLNFKNLINVLEIEVISSIDNVKLDKPKYGYLTEEIGDTIDINEFISSSSIEERLEVFIKISAAINTLNIKGYIFDDISLNDIKLIKDENNKFTIKINNIMEYEINKIILNDTLNIKSLIYPYNIRDKEDGSIKDNISQIVKIFNIFFSKQDLNEDLKSLKNINTIYNKINNFSKSIKDFINYINQKMNTEYSLFDYEACNKIYTDINIIGMEEELKIVDKNIRNVLENRKSCKIIGFIGGIGSGKTKLINEIKYRIDNKYFSNILYFSDKKINFDSFFENIRDNINPTIIDKYKKYIIEFTSSASDKYSKNKKYKIINRVANFIYECTITSPLIILVDNLESKNDITLTLLKYLIFSRKKMKNIIFIFTLNENKCSNDIIRCRDILKDIKEYEGYKISFFNQYHINEMIRNMLGFGKNSNKIANQLYYKTLGNPLFTIGVLEELYENKLLFFDKKICGWNIAENITKFSMPKKLIDKLRDNIQTLNKKESDILNKLSIFNSSLSENIVLNNILDLDVERESYYSLKKKGFLTNEISDLGVLIGFSNTLLKKLLYNNLDSNLKYSLHKKACKFFEDMLLKTDYYIDELIFQIEGLKDNEKLYFYTMICGEAADLTGNTLKSIKYYKKALKCCNPKKFSEIALIIAKLYMKSARNREAYKYFSKANEYAVKDNNYRIQIYALIEMMIIKIKGNSKLDLTYPLMVVKQLLDEDNYIVEEAYYYYACALKYNSDYDIVSSYNNAIKALEICEKNKIDDEIYGAIKFLIAELLFKEGKVDESKEKLKEAEQIFKEKNNINEYLNCKLRILDYFSEKEPNDKRLVEFIEINKLSNKNEIYTVEILSYVAISFVFIEERKFEEAEKYLLKAMERQREDDLNNYSFKIFNNLCLIYIRLSKVSKAVKYYYLVEQLKDNFKLSEEDSINFSIMAIEYNYLIFNYKKVKIYSDDVYGLVGLARIKAIDYIRYKYHKFKLEGCKNKEEVQELYYLLEEQMTNIENKETRIEIKMDAIRRIVELGYTELAKKLFLEIEYYPKEYENEAKYIYLEFHFKYKNYYNFLINKALRVCVYLNNNSIKSELYSIVAEKYEELNCKLLAFIYYYESLELYIEIINELIDSDKIEFINNSRFIRVRKLFIKCIESLNIDIEFKKIDNVTDNNQIEIMLKELSTENLLSNEKIHKLMEEFYEKCYCNNLNNIYMVFESFSSNIVMNLNNLIKYMARITLANKALLALEDDQGNNNIISMYRINDINESNYYISLNNESMSESILISNKNSRYNGEPFKYGLKSCLYIKLKDNESKRSVIYESINAKLILVSNNSINYINSESRKIVEEFVPFILFLLDNYKLSINSTLDRLTGAYNRKYFEEASIRLLENSSSNNVTFAVIMFDIDDFKGINDKYGHQKGDEILIKLVKQVKNTLSSKDILCRYGGEEFIILLPYTDIKEASITAEFIRKNVEKAKLLGDKRKVTISLGISIGTSKFNNIEELIKQADEALYMAKYNGRNRAEVWRANCGISNNINNNLTGVLSGNTIQDYNLALILKEITSLVINRYDKSYKINEFILRIMEVIECDIVGVFIVKENNIVETYTKQRENGKDASNIDENFDQGLIYKSIKTKEGYYSVDWDNVIIDNKIDVPEWKSICIKPVICNGDVIAVIYLSIPVSEKEYTLVDYNLLKCLVEVGMPMFY